MKDVGVVDVKYFKCMLFNQEDSVKKEELLELVIELFSVMIMFRLS